MTIAVDLGRKAIKQKAKNLRNEFYKLITSMSTLVAIILLTHV